MGVSTQLAQSPLDTRIQSPGSWDVLSEGLLVQARLGAAVLSSSSAALGNPGAFLFPTLPSLLC